MKINRIFAVLMAVIFIGSQPMAVLAEDVPNETENVSNETAESEELRDQSGFVENSFRYSNGQPIQKRSAGAYAISDTSNAYKKSMAFAIIHRENRLRGQSERSST